MIRLGGSGIDESLQDPWEMARAHRDFGYTAAYCPSSAWDDHTRLAEISRAFAQADVMLAEVGAWCNLMAADPAVRKRNRTYVCQRLAMADEVGARVCVDYIGSVAPDGDYLPDPYNLSPDGFADCVDVVREIIDTVQPKRAKFALEMMQWVLPDSPESCLALIKAVDRPQFAAHLDPVNLIVSPRLYFDNGDLIRRCFRLLAPHIVSCHAKDIILRGELSLHFDETPPGSGALDYAVLLQELNRLPGEIPLMLEHLSSPQAYAAARDHVLQVAVDNNIELYA